MLLATAGFDVATSAVHAKQGQTSDVAIVTTERGQPVFDACYVLVDFSNEGCDENGDGQITFQDVPLGRYTVRQTADLGPGRRVDDFTIRVRGNVTSAGWETFSATVDSSNSSSDVSGSVDIALITRDPETGDPLTGTCYVLLDFSNQGCDENGDGRVTFAAIPFGVYTVRQTQAPSGYPIIDDYAITVEPVEGLAGGGSFNVPLGFVVKQSRDQNAPDTRNVSVVLIDMTMRERVVAGVCVELVGASNVGCDDDVPDGQVDFLDVPAGGPYELRFTELPTGYVVGTVGGPLGVSVDAEPGAPANQMVFVLLADRDTHAGDAGIERTESEEVVEADGFNLSLDGVTVSGGPDAAPAGTTVRARPVAEDLPEEFSGFAEPAGNGIEVTLGEGVQPTSPLTITYAPDVVSGWDAAQDPSDDLAVVVLTSKPDGSGMELADAELLPDGSVVVTADHLSEFRPARVSISGFFEWLDRQVLIFAQVRSQQPDCVGQEPDDLDWELSAVPSQLLWACLDETAEGLEVKLTNNSPEVWLVGSDQAIPGPPIALSIVGTVFAAAAGLQVIDQATTAPVIPPDGSVTFVADGQDDPVVFDATLSQPLTIANAVVSGVLAFVPAKRLEALGRAECFIDIVKTSITVEEDLRDAEVAGYVGTIVRCMGEVIKGLGGSLISALGAVPGAGTAIVDTVVRQLTGRTEFSFTLSRVEDRSDAPNEWPSSRNDGVPGLFVWLGASFYDFPDWVACDDATTYCLVGYDGQEHLVIRVRGGFDEIGTVDDAATDPRGELLALGLPDEVVDQILAP